MKQYNVELISVILSVDIPTNKQYVLSLSNETIIFPKIVCDDTCLNKLPIALIENLQKYLNVTDNIEMIPQIINMYPSVDKKDTINIIYGFLVTKTLCMNNSYWHEFNYYRPNNTTETNIVFEVVQKLK